MEIPYQQKQEGHALQGTRNQAANDQNWMQT